MLAGTALVSSLLAAVIAPQPALAVDCTKPPSPGAIVTVAAEPITCVNTEPRTGTPDAIQLVTTANGSFIDLYNSGPLTSSTGIGIVAQTIADYSPITIVNVAPIDALGGITATTISSHSGIAIENDGDISAATTGLALQALTNGSDSGVSIKNTGILEAASATTVHAIDAASAGSDSPICGHRGGRRHLRPKPWRL